MRTCPRRYVHLAGAGFTISGAANIGCAVFSTQAAAPKVRLARFGPLQPLPMYTPLPRLVPDSETASTYGVRRKSDALQGVSL
jgi:hypothetical protein